MNNRFIDRATNCLIIGTALVVMFFTVTGTNGLLHLAKIDNEVKGLNSKTLDLRSEINAVNNKIYATEHSSFALEKHARETLSLSRPGEIVYIFPKTK